MVNRLQIQSIMLSSIAAKLDPYRILVLDDSLNAEETFKQIFREEINSGEYSIILRNNSKDAAFTAKEYNIEIALIDLAVPSSLSAMNQINLLSHHTEIIALSIHDDIAHIKEAMNNGASEFISKPAPAADITNSIKKAAEKASAIRASYSNEKQLHAINRELSLSAEIQANTLPGERLQNQFVDIYGKVVSAATIGGDFYDFFELPDNKISVVISDVSGKNISAALFTSAVSAITRTLSFNSKDPADCINKTNQALCKRNPMMMFATMIYGVIDPSTDIFTYVNAGHLLPILIRDNQIEEMESLTDTPIGIDDGSVYRVNSKKLMPGDLVLLYTDGVSEAYNRSREYLGKEKLLTLLRDSSRYTSLSLYNKIYKGIVQFVDGAEQADDITIICFKYKG